eukprot:GDKJ01031490.1.p1 GENE.GDKJ01031490.1~~GDKJ01031490.1.p1  ORF type:complete len:164 (+),score=23.93 GDKJ01031490.1:121-612(+)
MEQIARSLCDTFVLNKEHSDENFDEILGVLGFGWLKRKISKQFVSECVFRVDKIDDRLCFLIDVNFGFGIRRNMKWFLDGQVSIFNDPDAQGDWEMWTVVEGDSLVSYRSSEAGILREARRLISESWSSDPIHENAFAFFPKGVDLRTGIPSVKCTRYLTLVR